MTVRWTWNEPRKMPEYVWFGLTACNWFLAAATRSCMYGKWDTYVVAAVGPLSSGRGTMGNRWVKVCRYWMWVELFLCSMAKMCVLSSWADLTRFWQLGVIHILLWCSKSTVRWERGSCLIAGHLIQFRGSVLSSSAKQKQRIIVIENCSLDQYQWCPVYPVHTKARFQFSYKRNQSDWEGTILPSVHTTWCICAVTTKLNIHICFIIHLLNKNRPESCFQGTQQATLLPATPVICIPFASPAVLNYVRPPPWGGPNYMIWSVMLHISLQNCTDHAGPV